MSHAPDNKTARINMVEGQLRTNKVYGVALLTAMLNTPREPFVLDEYKALAYVDEKLPLGGGRFLLEPLVLARLLDEADVKETDKVLVVGAGSGYATALLSQLAGQVVALEEDDRLRGWASHALQAMEIANVQVEAGRLVDGCPAHGPYDFILVNGAVADVPATLLRQLTPTGRLAAVHNEHGTGRGVIMQPAGHTFSTRVLFDARSAYLPGFEPKPQFRFAS